MRTNGLSLLVFDDSNSSFPSGIAENVYGKDDRKYIILGVITFEIDSFYYM